MPPKELGTVELSQGGHGWVNFSMDGRYAWTHTPDVIKVKTKRPIATLRDENGVPVAGSKYFEIQFRNGKVMNVGSEFGVWRR